MLSKFLFTKEKILKLMVTDYNVLVWGFVHVVQIKNLKFLMIAILELFTSWRLAKSSSRSFYFFVMYKGARNY